MDGVAPDNVSELDPIADMIRETIAEMRSGKPMPSLAARLRFVREAAIALTSDDSDAAVLLDMVLVWATKPRLV